jgi:hypothetical protein
MFRPYRVIHHQVFIMNQLMLEDCVHLCKHYWHPKDVRSLLTLTGS